MRNFILALALISGAGFARAEERKNPDSHPGEDEPMMMQPRKMKMHGNHHGGNSAMPMFGELIRAAGKDAVISVEQLSDGVAIKITSKDAKAVARIKKAGEIMKLSRELEAEMPKPPVGEGEDHKR